MSLSNYNGTITVSDIIRGHRVSQRYIGVGVHEARRRFAAYVRKHCQEAHYA